ncbi:PAS domain S-box protein [Halocatena marina]|uniref:PAS domain S-box protein n=1 Tax=Halocatena marina TaxID=2934937 RepID=UPI00200C0F62|nr:PAS domain S-box protein [Halocatena marina]
MDESVRVLVVDDTSSGAERTAQSLERADGSITTITATSTDEALSYLTSGEPVDCIVCDHGPTGIDGIDTLQRVRRDYDHPDLPFILFTDKGTEELLSRAITAGVSEYIKKTSGEECYIKVVDRIRELTAIDQSSTPPQTIDHTARRRAHGASLPTMDQLSPMEYINLHRFAESNLIGVFLIQNLSFEYVNEELAAIFGYTCEELRSEVTVPDIVHEKDRASLIRHLQRREWNFIDELQYTFRGVRKDGSVIHVEIHSDRIDAKGNPSVFGLLMDVTARKQQEEEFKRYEQMVNTAGDIVYALDPDGQFTFINETGLHLTGYDREKLLDEHVSIILDDDEISEGQARIRKLLADTSQDRASDSYEITIKDSDGTIVPCRTNITPLTHVGEFNGTVGVVRDITKQKDLEELLRTERDQFAALFENISEPTIQYIIRDGSPHVEAVNPAFEEMFGHSEEDILGESLDALILPLGRSNEAKSLNERVIDGDRLEIEVCRMTNDGLRDFRLSNAPISVGEEPVQGYAIYRDITDRKRREYELERQNEQLEEFASVVSHDLRQPLSIASGRLSIIREEYDTHHLDDIEDALERMETLTKNVLTLARRGKVVRTPTPTAIDEIVHDAWDISRTGSAELAVDGTLTVIDADEQRLQELFENLFRNAIEHGGDDVTVTVGMLDENGFYIEDDGPGIPPEDRERVFERGYSTDANGTGLGLVIVLVIVQAHEWSIDVTEGTSGGARFEIRERPY